MKLKELKEKKAAAIDAANVINDLAKKEGRELTDAEATVIDEHIADSKATQADIAKAEKSEKRQADLAKAAKELADSAGPRASLDVPGKNDLDNREEQAKRLIPASVIQRYNMKAFTGPPKEANEAAYKAGKWFQAIRGYQPAVQWCKDYGYGDFQAVHTESVNTTGGYLVPAELENFLINLQETFGVFRGRARIVRMTSDKMMTPRRSTGLTHSYVGENSAGTESTMGLDLVELSAKKGMVIGIHSNELAEDAIMSIADLIVAESAARIAEAEDTAGFTGVGAAATGGITGIRQRVTDATATLITAASGTDSDWAGVILGDFHDMIGLLPDYADTPNTAWFVHRAFFAGVMQRLITAAGGNTTADLQSGTSRNFLGFPVEVTQTFPSTASAAEVVCCLGDNAQASTFGDRRGITMKISEEATIGSVDLFTNDLMAVRVTHRFDIVVHDVGNTTVAGSLVGLLTAV